MGPITPVYTRKLNFKFGYNTKLLLRFDSRPETHLSGQRAHNKENQLINCQKIGFAPTVSFFTKWNFEDLLF